MKYFVPFSRTVCVAGSAGTWLAEYEVHRSRPHWEPSDIDVFVMVQSPLLYESLCNDFVDSFAIRMGLTQCRTSVTRKHSHIFNVHWWVTRNGIEVECPEFSLIHSPNLLLSSQLLNQFDIDICRVSVHVTAGTLSLRLSNEVLSNIRLKHMHCVVRHDPSSAMFHYPMQRTLVRIQKYVLRGYEWKSLLIQPNHRSLNQADIGNLRIVSTGCHQLE
jgi:hypothetical protein